MDLIAWHLFHCNSERMLLQRHLEHQIYSFSKCFTFFKLTTYELEIWNTATSYCINEPTRCSCFKHEWITPWYRFWTSPMCQDIHAHSSSSEIMKDVLICDITNFAFFSGSTFLASIMDWRSVSISSNTRNPLKVCQQIYENWQRAINCVVQSKRLRKEEKLKKFILWACDAKTSKHRCLAKHKNFGDVL